MSAPETIGFLIVDVARLLRAEFDRRIVHLGLTPAEARTLSHVARCGPMRQSVLAERIGVEAMTLSACLDRLEEQGLVQRTPDPSDRRAKLANITEAARPVLDKILRASAEMRSDMTDGIDAEDVEAFRNMLAMIRTNLAAMRPECGKASPAHWGSAAK